MKTFNQFQEDMSKLPKLPGLGGGGGGTDSITDKAPYKSLKKKAIDAVKISTIPARFLLNIKSKPDPTEKFADSRMTPKEKVTSAIRDYKKQKKVNEGVAALAVKGGSKLIPALMTGIGAAGTYFQSRGKFGKDAPQTRKGLKNIVKNVDKNKLEPDTASDREELIAKSKPEVKNIVDKEIKKDQGLDKILDKIRNRGKGPFADTPSAEELRKAKLTGQLIKPKQGEVEKTKELIDKYKKTNKTIKPKEGEIAKQKELIKKAEKEITKPKKGEKKKAKKVVDTFKKVRKKEGETMMKIKQDDEIATKGPGDQLPGARRDYLNKLLKNLRKEEVAIANSMSGGGIAGSVEAGDEPPVKKKKKTYAYGGRGSRKMWMTNK